MNSLVLPGVPASPSAVGERRTITFCPPAVNWSAVASHWKVWFMPGWEALGMLLISADETGVQGLQLAPLSEENSPIIEQERNPTSRRL
ncbi:MAG: hypothetical protein E3J72_15170 [Planctomycetota bacterium]|nr:MAG: hypothetical protein E3J72_15170 [Planctomycetota bacterium]